MTKNMMNNRGALTLDFIFAIVLVTGLSAVLMTLSLSLVVVEVLQYTAFASSRAYFGSHVSETEQAALAEAKFNQIKSNKAFAMVFNKDWFDIKYQAQHDFRDEYADDPSISTFVGTRLLFEAKVLGFTIPLYGSTSPNDTAFKAKINSYLGREPTREECMQFVKDRWQNIQQLENGHFSGVSQVSSGSDGYVPIADNGC